MVGQLGDLVCNSLLVTLDFSVRLMTFNTAAKYELNKSIKNIVIDIRFSPKQMIPYTETK